MDGVVKRLQAEKGFGFVRADGEEDDRFFHRSGMAPGHRFEDLQEGSRVHFSHQDSPKGPRANQVQVA
jgi:CspA family cold shock protein